MQTVDTETFYRHISTFTHVPFTQTKAWIEAKRCLCACQLIGFVDTNISCIGVERRFAGIRWLTIEDECLRSESIKNSARIAFYTAIREAGYDIIEVNNRQSYQPEFEVAMRQAGLLRPVGSFSCQLTNIIALTEPLSFNENWRRNLKKAAQSQLQLRYAEEPDEQDIERYFRLYREMSEHKQIGTPFNREYIRTLLESPHFRLYFVEHEQQEIAAIIVHTAGTHAGLLYAANSERANELCAGAYMYEQVMLHLADSGFCTFDMEKLLASTHSTNSVFIFKQGVKGQLSALNGEWSYYKRVWMGIGLFLLKKLYWKNQQV